MVEMVNVNVTFLKCGVLCNGKDFFYVSIWLVGMPKLVSTNITIVRKLTFLCAPLGQGTLRCVNINKITC